MVEKVPWSSQSIKALRSSRGWNQEELANVLGMSVQSVQRHEQNRIRLHDEFDERMDALLAAINDETIWVSEVQAQETRGRGEERRLRVRPMNALYDIFQVCRVTEGLLIPILEVMVPHEVLGALASGRISSVGNEREDGAGADRGGTS